MDVRSPTSANLLPDSELKSPAGVAENNTGKNAAAAVVTMRSQSNKHSPPQSRTKDIVRNLLEDMPCVSTKGEGPNGKRIEGFLYRYGKGEEVRIVCVCHGSFLTPSEFVKHAGGGDVANPLKHIVVSPSLLWGQEKEPANYMSDQILLYWLLCSLLNSPLLLLLICMLCSSSVHLLKS